MGRERDSGSIWGELAEIIAALPNAKRTRIHQAIRVFAHDLRESYSQIHSAEDLLRRMYRTRLQGKEYQEWGELLDVIRSANRNIHQLLSDDLEEALEKLGER